MDPYVKAKKENLSDHSTWRTSSNDTQLWHLEMMMKMKNAEENSIGVEENGDVICKEKVNSTVVEEEKWEYHLEGGR